MIILNDIMLDLETLATDNNALITTINAVQCNLRTGETGKEFEIAVDWNEQLVGGAVIDPDTVAWWLNQSKEAQETMMRLQQRSVKSALENFTAWVDENFEDAMEVKLWGNGATFDNIILENLFKRHNAPFPLPYCCHKDVRTLVDIGNINTRDFEFEGIKHRGIDDCKHQIKYCYAAFENISNVNLN